MAFALFLLTIPVLNVVDLAFYAFNWMQTQNAAQMGAQAGFSNCNVPGDLPAATLCYGPSNSADNMTLYDAVSTGIQESALNNTVTLTNSNVVDGYFCSTSSGVLTQIGNLGYAYADNEMLNDTPSNSDTAPSGVTATCGTNYADSNATPGEYVRIDVTHTYQSIFPGMTVVALLPSVMTATAYARVD